jgi:hypothetical protein
VPKCRVSRVHRRAERAPIAGSVCTIRPTVKSPANLYAPTRRSVTLCVVPEVRANDRLATHRSANDGILCAVSKSNVITRVLIGDRLECQVVSPEGEKLTLTGHTTDVEPAEVEGSAALGGNRALVNNAWAFAKFTYQKVNLPSQEEQKLAEKSAKAYQEVAEWLADLADDLEIGTKRGWCSSCFAKVDHRKGKRPFGQIPAYLCSNCGSPTLVCADPTCENMAVRGRGAIRVPRFCAEHRHEIPGFEKGDDKMDTLVDYGSSSSTTSPT